MKFEDEVPMGNPAATLCRWGHGARILLDSALFCPVCDGAGYHTARTNRGFA